MDPNYTDEQKAIWQRGYNAGYESGGRDADLGHSLAATPSQGADALDARRYRWLRENGSESIPSSAFGPAFDYCVDKASTEGADRG